MSELSNGWSLAPLMENVDLHDSRRIPLNQRERAERQGPFPYYGANGQVDSINDYIFDGEFILLAEDGGYFDDPARDVAYEVSGKFWVNNHAHILSPKNGIPRRYLTYALNQLDWTPHVGGSTRLKLTQEGMRRIRIPLAPRAERERIVAKLDSLLSRSKTAREELAHIPRLAERYKEGILAAAFRGELTADWRHNRNIRTAAAVPLEEALLQIKTGPFGSTLHKSDYVSGGVPIVNPMHINQSKITPSRDTSITLKKAGELAEFQLKERDVIIARRGEMGRCAVVNKHEHGWLCGTGSMILRPASSLLPHYLQMFLSSPSTITSLKADAVGSTMVNLNQKILLSLTISLPPVDEQAEVILRVQKAFERVDGLAAEAARANALLDRLDQATLAKAFRGELFEKAI